MFRHVLYVEEDHTNGECTKSAVEGEDGTLDTMLGDREEGVASPFHSSESRGLLVILIGHAW